MIENPILKGFCPDPSIIRVGQDYYIATSTFEWWPGIRLFHSRDLANWEQLPSPICRQSQIDMRGDGLSCGIWAPCLSFSDGMFWLIYTDVKNRSLQYQNTHNYLIWTDNILGEWSDPVYLNSSGFDPSLFHHPLSGKKYLVIMRNGFKGILLQEYDHQQKRLVGERRCIFQGTEKGKTEGPHLYYHNNMYYLMVAEGGTGYNHCETVARSNDIWGPYEPDPAGSLITACGDDKNPLQKAGHADLTDTPDGEWYIVHLCSRPIDGHNSVLGRETALQKVHWTADGWLRLHDGTNSPAIYVPKPKNTPKNPFPQEPIRDDFESEKLDLRYSYLRASMDTDISLTERPGFLRLHGCESFLSFHRVSLIAHRQQHFNCVAQTAIDFYPLEQEHFAGLAYFYDNHNFYMLGKTLDAQDKPALLLLKNDKGTVSELALMPISNSLIHIKVEVQRLNVRFFYSLDSENWSQVGSTCNGSNLTDEYTNGFTGAHFALYCHDLIGFGHYADFDYFEYKNFKTEE